MLLTDRVALAIFLFMNLVDYYTSLTPEQKKTLADRLGTSQAYVSQIFYGHRKAGVKILARIELATDGVVTPSDLRPDIYDRPLDRGAA